jgi:S1-C subfamily serine protease
LLGAALAALVLAACSSDDEAGSSDDGDGSSAAAATSTAPEVTTEQAAVPLAEGFDTQKLYADAAKGVVTVRSVFGQGDALSGGQGSGFVINDNGEIVTNAHVVTDAEAAVASDLLPEDEDAEPQELNQADEVFVEFTDRNQVPAEVIGFDPNADVALLKVDPDGLDFEPLELGDSEKVAVGTPVAAIGSPFGQEQSLSTGIVSATDRSIESLTSFRIEGAVQTDASINPGNSGGPLIDPNGRVIGVNQQINTTSGGNEGVGFAVPANLVQRSIDDLRDDGKAEYAFIGVRSLPLYPQLAQRLEIDAPTGSLITTVNEDSPADSAGLRGAGDQTIEFQGQEIEVGGDVIVAIDGQELVGESDLSRLISAARPGDRIELDVIRDGDRERIQVTLKARDSS